MNKVVTVGLGYIGLPTSALIANFGLKVHGVDINQKVVDTINKGKIHIVEPELDKAVRSAVLKGNLIADTKPVEADVYLIVVPTPFKEGHKPDISYVQSATDAIIPFLKKGDLFIIESTSPIGTTEKMRDRIYNSRPDLIDEISIAYCPERVLPGNVMYELVNNDRVIGGVNSTSTKDAIRFYKQFVKGALHSTDARTAEMCKLVENSSRDSQIAFANELSLIADKADIDVWELIDLANKHPRVNILQPGCGVGGHCIAVDPYFLTSDYPNETLLISTARNVNINKSRWVTEKIISRVNDFEKKNKRSAVFGLLGLAFKANIDDLRESPALEIAKDVRVKCDKNEIYFVEPNITNHAELEISSLNLTIERCDLIFVLVAHKEFMSIQSTFSGEVIQFVK